MPNPLVDDMYRRAQRPVRRPQPAATPGSPGLATPSWQPRGAPPGRPGYTPPAQLLVSNPTWQLRGAPPGRPGYTLPPLQPVNPFAGVQAGGSFVPTPPPQLGTTPAAPWLVPSWGPGGQAQPPRPPGAVLPGPLPGLGGPGYQAPGTGPLMPGSALTQSQAAQAARYQGMADAAALAPTGPPTASYAAVDKMRNGPAESFVQAFGGGAPGGGFGPFGSFEQWQSAFAAEHGGRQPNEQDVLDAQDSFDFAAQTGRSPTEKDWLRRYYNNGYWPGDVSSAGGAIYQQMTGRNVLPPGLQVPGLPGMPTTGSLAPTPYNQGFYY